WIMWPDGSWSSTAERVFPLKEITADGWNKSKSDWLGKKRKSPSVKKRSNKNWNGFNRILKEGAQRARRASINIMSCSQRNERRSAKRWRFLFRPGPGSATR